MSREIKFRAWDNETKDLRQYEEISGICLSALNATDWDLEQFTGLKDANGKEIYENDIIKVLDETDSSFVSVVKYFDYNDYPAFDLDPQYLPTDWYFEANILSTLKADGNEMEVLGNVHNNPELLEEK